MEAPHQIFAGSKLVVIGGSSGIGLSTAEHVHQRGGEVVLLARDPEKLERAGALFEGGAHTIPVDIADKNAVDAVREQLTRDHADANLLVNSAGVYRPQPFLETSREDYRRYSALNEGTFLLTQSLVESMVAAGRGGAIVNVGAVIAQQAITGSPAAAFSMAKAGLLALTQQLAAEFAPHGIRVNSAVPSTTMTPIYEKFMTAQQVREQQDGWDRWHPLGRIGDPDEVAATISFLLSKEASWVTGATWNIDGGVLGIRS